jgi:hypothetical protein
VKRTPRIELTNTKKKLSAAFSLFLLVAVVPVAAQQPPITNAKLETRSAAAGLSPAFRALEAAQAAPAWIAYAVPAVSGRQQMCCYDFVGRSPRGSGCCRLEEESDGVDIRTSDEKPNHPPKEKPVEQTVHLEARPYFFVFFRAEHGKVNKVRMFSADCAIDAGGRAVYWLADVRGAESVELLSTFVRAEHWADRKTRVSNDDDEDDDDDDGDGESVGHAAIAAIAFHADPAADAALDRFVESAQPESLRKQAAFWLGVARGRHGYEVLRRMVHDDPSDRVREQAIFALSQSKVPEAVDTMIETARHDRSTHVRGQALFWLAQRAGRRAQAAITAAIENDPETDVKKKAVFALSQLPRDEGVPLLIQVARSNRNPVVRKQAIFWLGQSNDPRALNYIEEVLKP